MANEQRKGLNYEHDLAQEVFKLSEGKIIPMRSGFSGNQALPSPDLLIPFGGSLVALENKCTWDDTSLIVEPEDLEQIRYWAMRMSEVPTHPYLSIKFAGRSNRLLYVTRLTRLSNPQKAFENVAEKCPFDANVTRTGNLSFKKPDLDQWPSTRGGDGPKGLRDGYMLLDTLKNDEFEQPSVLDVIEQKNSYLKEIGKYDGEF